jgi:hypothetical protein
MAEGGREAVRVDDEVIGAARVRQLEERIRELEFRDVHMALLIEREHHGMGRRVDIQADDRPELLGERWILRQLEGLPAVRLQAVRSPEKARAKSSAPSATGNLRTGISDGAAIVHACPRALRKRWSPYPHGPAS